jgi:hypothetical protein
MADNKITLEQIELTKRLADERQRLLDLADAELAAEIRAAELRAQTLSGQDILKARLDQRVHIAEKLRTLMGEQEAVLGEQLKIEAQRLDEMEKQGIQTGEELEALKEKHALTWKEYQIITDPKRRKAMEDALITVKETRKAQSDNLEDTRSLAAAMGAVVGVSDNWEKSIAGSAFRLMQTEDGIKNIGKSLANTFSFQNVGASLMGKVTEATIELLRQQDSAIATFKASTGAGDAYNDVIVDTQLELRTYGVSAAEAGKATEALFKQMSQYTEMSKSAQKELAGTTALLGKFGISGQAAASSMEVFNKALGMSAHESAAAAREMFALGKGLGIAPEIIFSEFGPAAKQLAAHGDNMIQVFEGLAAASKATGVEMGNLLSLATQFDEFSSGAEAVGKLNALLGGPYLNSIEMLNATEEERIRLLLQSMEASGKNFDQLGKYEQKAIAASVGITDMAEANKLFNTSLSAYDAMQHKAAAASISQKEFEEASQNAMSVVEKFTTIMENFAVSISPLLDALGWVADGILALQKEMGNGFGIVVLITGAILFLTGTILSFGLAAKFAGKLAGEGLADGIEKVGEAAGKAGKGAMQGAVGMLAFGAAMLATGAGIYFAAIGVAELVKSFGELNGGQIAGALLAITIGMVGLYAVIVALGALAQAGVGALGVAMLIGIGVAVTAIGYGVKLAAEGLAVMLPNLGKFITSLSELPIGTILLLTTSLLGLASVAPFLAAGLALLGVGFIALAVGIWAMMAAIDVDKLKALADLASSITTMLFGPEGETTPAGGGGGPAGSPFTDMISAVNNLDEEKIDFAKQLAEVAMDYNAQVVDNFGTTGTAPFTAATAGVGAGPAVAGAGTGGANLPPLYLVLNNEIFGRLVAKELAKGEGLNVTKK